MLLLEKNTGALFHFLKVILLSSSKGATKLRGERHGIFGVPIEEMNWNRCVLRLTVQKVNVRDSTRLPKLSTCKNCFCWAKLSACTIHITNRILSIVLTDELRHCEFGLNGFSQKIQVQLKLRGWIQSSMEPKSNLMLLQMVEMERTLSLIPPPPTHLYFPQKNLLRDS